jgi:hypothetical protein
MDDMKNMKIFVPITKIDAAQRLVYGIVTAEKPDVSGGSATTPAPNRLSEVVAKIC